MPKDRLYEIGKYPPVNQDIFLIARAHAIQAFATLEFSLCRLFSNWVGTSLDIGGLVFFRIINTRSRNKILDDLKEHRFQKQYNLFWNSFLKLVVQLDERRNHIVHWHVVNTINLDLPDDKAARITLSPPAGWASKSPASLDENDLDEFIRKCQFASHLANMFSFVRTEHEQNLGETWLGIFQQPIAYPPPDTHPLSPNYKAPETPPAPSRV